MHDRDKLQININTANDYFAEIVQSTTTYGLEELSSCDQSNDFEIEEVTNDQVFRKFQEIKDSSAGGCDDLSAPVLKQISRELAPYLTKIYNSSIRTSSVPLSWKKANVKILWKGKGKKDDPSNYRPISVLPIMARVFEKLVAEQMYSFCDVMEIIPSQQFGFRKHSSCETALISATNNWMKEIDDGNIVGALLIDLSKAFDSVPHDKLLAELLKIGCSNKSLGWFRSYLTDRHQRVLERPNSTEWKDVSRGVPQGSCLSPLLFNIFVREIPSICKTDTYQYADDITQSQSGKDVSHVVDSLSKSFEITKQFCDNKNLAINTKKTQFLIMHAQGKRISEDIEILIGEETLKPVKSVKLLGVTIDRYLTFGPHIDTIISKANSLLHMLSKASVMLPTALLRTVYISLVRAHLESCSAVWASAASSHLHRIDVVQKRAVRIIMNKPRDTHSAPLEKTLKLDSLESRRHNHIINIVRKCLLNDYNPALDGLFNWCPTNDHIIYNKSCRINVGKRRFENFAGELFERKFC